MVVLVAAIGRPEERVEARQVDGVVPLHVEQPVRDSAVVDAEADDARIGESLGVREARRVRAVPEGAERPLRPESLLEEARGRRRRVVGVQVDSRQLMDAPGRRVAGERLLAGHPQIGEHEPDHQQRDRRPARSSPDDGIQRQAGQQRRHQHEDGHDAVGQVGMHAGEAWQQPDTGHGGAASLGIANTRIVAPRATRYQTSRDRRASHGPASASPTTTMPAYQ